LSARQSQADFWLGARGEELVTDFDGHVRACYRLGTALLRADPSFRYIWVRVDPPMPLPEGRHGQEIALKEEWEGFDINHMADRWLGVYVFEIVDRSACELGSLDNADLRLFGRGEVAKSPALLPMSQEQDFEQKLALLQRFAAREGHTDVSPGYAEDDVPLGNWVANTKYSQAKGGLRPEWESRLQALPGWRWLSGDDFFLLARFAIEHGHTRVPLDYVDEGRPIGQWVNELRKTHTMGMLSGDWIRRLEKIPGWEW
jgi:helicase associated protein